MGLPLKLTIRDHRNGTDYVYDDTRLLSSVEEVQRRVRDLDIELEDVPLAIGPPDSGPNELIGITDPLQLPEGTFRAKLERPGGQLLVNGAVVMRDVIYENATGEWVLRVINQAPKDFWGLLDRSFVGVSPGPGVPSTLVEAQVKRGDVLFEENKRFWQPKGLLQFILDEHNIGYSMPNYLWEYEVEYDAAGGSVVLSFDSSTLRMSLGSRNEKVLVEEITNLAGWRIEVRYKGFPSSELEADFLPTTWPAPAASAVLDSDVAAEDYKIEVEESPDNWALTLNNAPDLTAPDPRDLNYKNEDAADLHDFAYPPSYGAIAPQVWRAAKADSVEHVFDGVKRPVDPRDMIADITQSKFEAPPIAPERQDTAAGGREYQVYGRLFLEDVEPTPLRRLDTKEKLFLFEVKTDDPDTNDNYGMLIRHPQSGREIPSGILSHTAGWASSAYQGQPLRRKDQFDLEGPFIDIGQQSVGDPRTTVEVSGEKWHGFEEQRDVTKNVNELNLRRPKGPINKVPDRPTIPNTGGWIVVKPRAEFRTLNLSGGKSDWFLINWEPTPLRQATETWYHVEYRDNANNGSWTRINQDIIGASHDRIYGTSLIWLFGGSGRTPSENDIVGRVRPVKTYGIVGDWRTFRIESN